MVTKIRVLALDIDGVITDGTAALSDNGEEEKRYSFQDLDAVTQDVADAKGPAEEVLRERLPFTELEDEIAHPVLLANVVQRAWILAEGRAITQPVLQR